MTNDLNDHFPHSLRSLLAEVLKTIETIGTIFFPCLRTSQSPSRSTLSLCQSKKRANIWGMFTACFCSPSSRTSCLLFCENPQVTFASLSSPAVMDIRPLRGRPLLAEVLTTIEARRFLIFFLFPDKKEGKCLFCLIFIAFRARFCRQLFTFAATY